MSATKDREQTLVFVDLATSANSTEALQHLEQLLEKSSQQWGAQSALDIYTGGLLLTPGVLSKIHTLVQKRQLTIDTLYSEVPQTQQSALDEGLLVRASQPRSTGHYAYCYQGGQTDAFSDIFDPPANTPEVSLTDNVALDPSPKPYQSKPTLSVTLEDGTRQEVQTSDVALSTDTLFYRQTLRSGQVLESAGNIIIVGDVHSGSEVIAGGDIVVWGVLGGVAHAGSNGYNQAQIRALRIEAVQLRIGQYIARRPDRLFKGKQKRQGPEVAQITEGEVRIYQENIDR